jgi:transcriptional regulator with XRE-family HTH domain
MKIFSQKEILSGSTELFKLLLDARSRMGLSLFDASKKTGINLKYLEKIEAGRFEELPEGLYARNIIREYAQFLGLDAEAILDDLQKEKIEPGKFSQETLFSRKAPSKKFFLAVPKLVKNIFIFLGIVLCLSYLGYSLFGIISPPKLEIASPSRDITINSDEITIIGNTEKEAGITINGELVLADREGNFSKTISLKKGTNIITIVSQKKYSRNNTVERKVISW